MTLAVGQKQFSNQMLEYQWLREPPFLRQKSPNLAWHRSGISAPRAPSRDRRRSASSICHIYFRPAGSSDKTVEPSLNDSEKWVAIIFGRSGSTEQEGHSRLGLLTVASDALIVFG